MEIVKLIDYTVPSHICLKEGDPVPYFTSSTQQMVYPTIYPTIYLVSLRKGYKVHHFYVNKERVAEVVSKKSLVCE